MEIQHTGLSAESESDRSRKCLMFCPSSLYPSLKRAWVDSKFTCPIDHDQTSSVWMRQPYISSRISHLFCMSAPSAVPQRIRPIIVNSIDRMLVGWAWTNVCVKPTKVSSPFLADCDSTSPIGVVSSVARIVAAVFHLRPCAVFRAMAFAMNSVRLDVVLTTKASATFCCTLAKMMSWNHNQKAAIASTFPSGMRTHVWSDFEHKEARKSLTCQDQSTHQLIIPEHSAWWVLAALGI